jgi:hypothetical protein
LAKRDLQKYEIDQHLAFSKTFDVFRSDFVKILLSFNYTDSLDVNNLSNIKNQILKLKATKEVDNGFYNCLKNNEIKKIENKDITAFINYLKFNEITDQIKNKNLDILISDFVSKLKIADEEKERYRSKICDLLKINKISETKPEKVIFERNTLPAKKISDKDIVLQTITNDVPKEQYYDYINETKNKVIDMLINSLIKIIPQNINEISSWNNNDEPFCFSIDKKIDVNYQLKKTSVTYSHCLKKFNQYNGSGSISHLIHTKGKELINNDFSGRKIFLGLDKIIEESNNFNFYFKFTIN